MAKGKKISASDKAHYAGYKASKSWLKNKIRRYKRILKDNPNDTNAKTALDKAEKGTTLYKHGRK